MTNDNSNGYYVDTASGPVYIDPGVPSWVNDNTIAQAGGLIEQLAQPSDAQPHIADAIAPSEPAPSGEWVQAVNGPVWIPAGVPEWERQLQIDAAGGFNGPASQYVPVPTGPVGPVGPVAPPQGPLPTDRPAPVPLPAPTVQQPLPVGAPQVNSPPQSASGAVKDAAQTAIDAARRIASDAASGIGTVAADAGGMIDRITRATRSVLDALVPTVQELALGLTQRFIDLAGFVRDHAVELTDYAGTMAAHAASAMSTVLDDAWHWITSALMSIGNLLGWPVQQLINELFSGLEVGGVV